MTTKRVLSVQYGPHASNTDWSSTPGTLKFLQPVNEVNLEVGEHYVDREAYQTANGNPLPSRQIDKMAEVPDMTFNVHGLSGGGAGDGVSASTLDHALAEVLEALATSSTSGTGRTSGTQTGTTTLIGTGSSYGGSATGVLIAGVDGFVQAREVYGQSGITSNICRAVTTKAGASQQAADGVVGYGSRTYFFDNSTPNRVHLYFDLEGKSFRRELFGVMAQAVLEAPSNAIAQLKLNNIMCTDWEKSTPAAPSYSAPTQGNEVKMSKSPCWIGSTMYIAKGLKVDFGVKIEKRPGDGGPNGHYGCVVVEVVPRLSFRLFHGSLTAPSEVDDDTFETLKADGVFDILYQVGNAPGRALAVRAPAADLKVKQVIDGGRVAYDVEALCCDASDVSTAFGAYPLRLHIF